MPDNTPLSAKLEPPQGTVRTTLLSGAVANDRPSVHAIDAINSAQASREQREAILASLYTERAALNRSKRAAELRPGDEEFLRELNAYIDRWEAPEADAEARQSEVWTRLNALASSMLSLQTRVERNRK